MRDPSFYVSGLLDLPRLAPAERRATWRQSLAALARASVDEGPGPLDGLHPDALVKGARAALQSGLVEDLDWLAPSAAGIALYELASALAPGPEQRELGRKLMARFLTGNAETFVAVATRMALGSAKGLTNLGVGSGPALRARVALVTELPIGLGIADGPLSLALVSRRNLAREWIAHPSTGSLPSRRLAARLLERAAREAARRASNGDTHALRAFGADGIREAWGRLLADRESLVWRHVASARGLLAPWIPDVAQEIRDAFDPQLTPTEWRRGACSLGAQIAVAPSDALRAAQEVLAGGLLDRHPGAAAAFVWGLARGGEAEPQTAAALLEALVPKAPGVLAEALVELRAEFGPAPWIDRASQRVLGVLGRRSRPDLHDDGADALALEVSRDLEQGPRDDQPLRQQLGRALGAFVTDGALAAYAAAREVLGATTATMDALEAVELEGDDGGPLARRASLAVLRDLDLSLLERNVLPDLLKLGPSNEPARAHEDALDAVRGRLFDWILAREGVPLPRDQSLAHPTLTLRRLRALLHLVDGDMGEVPETAPASPSSRGFADDGARAARLRRRWQRVARVLTLRFEREGGSVARRTVLAALARTLDALARAGMCDVSDVVLSVARRAVDPREVATLAEASMAPELEHAFARYAAFLQTLADTPPGDPERLNAFEGLARDLVPDASGRAEQLRGVLVRVHAGLATVAQAMSLWGLVPLDATEPEAVASLESAISALAQLALGARARLDPEQAPISPAATPVLHGRSLTIALSRVLSGAEPSLREDVVAACLEHLVAPLPKAVGTLVSEVLWGLVDLPIGRASRVPSAPPVRVAEPLPQWLPAHRTLGGFYVQRALGSGAVGSVFVVVRAEDRHDPEAERLALKVPEFSATAARSLSESEFLTMFRDEASALMAIPQHPNLARFVTFDAGARPKPILVMELVEGQTLDRLLESHLLDTPRALAVIDDVLAGLEAMHAVGVGHLDVKPSNVVLRQGRDAVLVDFGLAGRRIRPGCATGPYGAPEVWGAELEGAPATPPAADIYAFGCLAYEVLTARTLFAADSEMEQIAQHIAHDGWPVPLRELAARPGLAPLAELLGWCLRRDPRQRPSASAVRAELRRVAPAARAHPWPGAVIVS